MIQLQIKGTITNVSVTIYLEDPCISSKKSAILKNLQ